MVIVENYMITVVSCVRRFDPISNTCSHKVIYLIVFVMWQGCSLWVFLHGWQGQHAGWQFQGGSVWPPSHSHPAGMGRSLLWLRYSVNGCAVKLGNDFSQPLCHSSSLRFLLWLGSQMLQHLQFCNQSINSASANLKVQVYCFGLLRILCSERLHQNLIIIHLKVFLIGHLSFFTRVHFGIW